MIRRRLSALLVPAVLVGVVLPAAPAPAEGSSAGVAAEAWYWHSQAPSSSPAQLPSPDPDGHLPVALVGGQIEKEALIRLDLDPATVLSATVALAAPDDEPNSDANGDQAVVRACLVTSEWSAGVALPYDQLPKIDCDQSVPGQFSGTGADRIVTFDLSKLILAWSAGTPNNGFAIEPDTTQAGGQAPSSWQVGFHGSKRDGITVTTEAASSGQGSSSPSAFSSDASASPNPSAGVGSSSALPLPVGSGLDTAPASAAGPAPAVATPAAVPAPAASPAVDYRPAVLGGIPVDRPLESASWWALGLLALALAVAAVATARTRRQREVRLAGAALVMALLVLGATWQGAASQAATWAQVPYAASGALLATILAIIGATLGMAPVLAAVGRRRIRLGPAVPR